MCSFRTLCRRSVVKSSGRDRRLAECKLLVWPSALAVILGSVNVLAADNYFDKALGKIEQTLVRPADSYGFVVTDRLDSSSLRSEVTERFTFRTSNGKVYCRREKFAPGRTEVAPPRSKHTFVSRGRGQKATVIDSALGQNILTENFGPPGPAIGAAERYFYGSGTNTQYDISPDEQAFQILANPCFAPLRISPIRLKSLSITALANQGANQVYEVKWQEYDTSNTLRLHFSPDHGDALTKSEYEDSITDGSGKTHLLGRTVRTVQKWQALPDGTWVPARFTVRSESRGKLVSTLEREISSPVIGNLSDALFDPAQLAEFQVKWDTILDCERPYYSQRIAKEKETPAGSNIPAPTTLN